MRDNQKEVIGADLYNQTLTGGVSIALRSNIGLPDVFGVIVVRKCKEKDLIKQDSENTQKLQSVSR